MNSNDDFNERSSLIKKDGSELKAFTEKYPWCSIAQLSLLHHYKKSNSLQFEQQATKTALFFNNTNWLNWQLHLLSKESKIEETNLAEPQTVKAPEIHHENIEQTISNTTPSATSTTEEIITFEPLHTTDYFASQGIKLTDDPISNDKLGSQMKSFTEWLKSMKKIHQQNLPAGDEQTDKNIRQIAEHSNTVAEVVTEAMADILIKQDKKEKAIEVYEKLSLIYPSKSAYFAAKIDSLKTP